MGNLAVNVDQLLENAVAGEDGAIVTGRKIVTFREGETEGAMRAMAEAGIGQMALSSDFADQDVNFDSVEGAGALVFDELGVAVIDGDMLQSDAGVDGFGALSNSDAILAVEDETFVFADGTDLASYLAGFAAAAERIKVDFAGGAGSEPGGPDDDAVAAAAAATWGLIATRAMTSRYSGRGIKIAVLDTGIDLRHPDFAGRILTTSSFISGETVQDGNGHGTHCMGTAAGPRAPSGVPRYGIAHEARLFAGKVLSNAGSGSSATVLAGMNWAIANRCEVISMSLGGGGGPFTYYTQAGQRALDAGCLIIAAAGNSSRRPGMIAPTGSPANSPTIMAVSSINEALGMAPTSCGGKVEIAGPGENVFSAWPMPRRYRTISGTSMATPHVAGCAALFAQSNAALRGAMLRTVVMRAARRLPLPPRDVGVGLVQALQ